MKMIKLAF